MICQRKDKENEKKSWLGMHTQHYHQTEITKESIKENQAREKFIH